MSDYETIIYEKFGSRATVTLNRPDSLNGIVGELSRELYECLNICLLYTSPSPRDS